ncbi:DUF3180 domain-containing protein [Auraticoccus cholistanensis]|uniref:DUF3180 domain-containing protein n=1 Tax=Auraticoccus cholistanensis TaxID=2656650 RepID=UPI0012E9889D
MLGVALVIGALLGYGVSAAYRALDAAPPQVPWLSPATLLVLVAFVALLARSAHTRIQVRRERVEPSRAVVWLALGKAAAIGGAAVLGGYLAYGLSFWTRLEAESPRERLVVSLVAAVAGVLLTVAGLALERACRVPGDEDEENPEDDAEGRAGP